MDLLQRFLCCIGLHEWTMWDEPEDYGWESSLFNSKGTIMAQQRSCNACGRVQVRTCR